MLPPARLVDPRPLAPLRRAGRAARDTLRRSPGGFVVAHCAVAGVVQATALAVDVARAGGATPTLHTLTWAALGLAMVAAVPALLTALALWLRPPARRAGAVRTTLGIGAVFYLALPALLLGGKLAAIAVLVPAAIAWHAALLGLRLPAEEPARC